MLSNTVREFLVSFAMLKISLTFDPIKTEFLWMSFRFHPLIQDQLNNHNVYPFAAVCMRINIFHNGEWNTLMRQRKRIGYCENFVWSTLISFLQNSFIRALALNDKPHIHTDHSYKKIVLFIWLLCYQC